MFRVLCVCTGNICRSPAAEILLTANLDLSVAVTSAGTHGMPSWPISPPMGDLLRAQLPDVANAVASFRSRRLTEAMVAEADLVLALAGDHKSAILELAPTALRRTFTLGEFARLAHAAVASGAAPIRGAGRDSAWLEVLIPAAAHQRRRLPSRARGDDVLDPYGLPIGSYRHSLAQIEARLATLGCAARREPAQPRNI